MKLILALILCITVVASAATLEKLEQCGDDKQCETKGTCTGEMPEGHFNMFQQ